MKEECYIVVHRNYADGTMAYAFRNEEEARKDIDDDVSETVQSLSEQGYKAVALKGLEGSEVFVPDSDIYYEWELVSSTIR